MNNLTKIYVHQSLFSFNLWMPVWVLFLLDRDITMAQIAIADGVYMGTSSLFEFPAGKISDKFGAKKVLIYSTIIFTAAIIALTFTYSMTMLLIAWILWGISSALSSGSDQALLHEITNGDKFKVAISNLFMISLVCTSIGSIIATSIYEFSPMLPFLINIVLAALAVIPLIFIKLETELPQHQRDMGFKEYFKSIDFPEFKWILIGSLTMMCFWSPTLFYQPYFKHLSINIEYFGYIYVIAQFVGALFSKISGSMTSNTKIIIFGVALLAIGIFMFMLNSLIGVLGIILMWAGFYLTESTVSEQILSHTDKRAKATALSFKSFIAGIGLLFLRTYAGHYSDTAGLEPAVSILSYFLFALLVMIIIIYFFKKETAVKES
jgi:MFS family permease